jgi:hypothetical protein
MLSCSPLKISQNISVLVWSIIILSCKFDLISSTSGSRFPHCFHIQNCGYVSVFHSSCSPSSHNCTNIILQGKNVQKQLSSIYEILPNFFLFISFRRQCFKPYIYLNMSYECTEQETDLFYCWATDSRTLSKQNC